MRFSRAKTAGVRSIVLSAVVLLASNLFAIWLAMRDGWGLAELMTLYWCQSVIIGVFCFIRILTFRQFEPDVRINKRPIDDTRNSQFKVALFFFFHFGGFHFGYFMLLRDQFPCDPAATGPLLIGAASFLLAHFIGFLGQHAHDIRTRPSIGTTMFFPYLRVLPMHLAPFCGWTLASGDYRLPVFIALKLISDLLMHIIEEAQMAEGAAGEESAVLVVGNLPQRIRLAPAGPAGAHWHLLGAVLVILSGSVLVALVPKLGAVASTFKSTAAWKSVPCRIIGAMEVTGIQPGARKSGAPAHAPQSSHRQSARSNSQSRLFVQFSYDYAGRTYKSAVASPWYSSLPAVYRHGEHKSPRDVFTTGSIATCYVNPINPAVAVLEKDPPAILALGYLMSGFVPVVLLIAGLIISITTARGSAATGKIVYAAPRPFPLQPPNMQAYGNQSSFPTAPARPPNPRKPQTLLGRVAELFCFGFFWNAIVFVVYFHALLGLLAGHVAVLLLILFLTPFVGVGIGEFLVPLLLAGLGKMGIRPFGIEYNLMDKQRVQSLSPVALCGGIFQMCVGGWLMVHLLLPTVQQWQMMRNWQPQPCEILSCAVSNDERGGTTLYDLDVRYRFRLGDTEMTANRYALGWEPTSFHNVAEQKANQYHPGTKATCYVDPANPRLSVLTRDMRGMRFGIGAIGSLVFIVGCIALGIGGKSWVKDNLPASGAARKWERVVFWSLLLFGWCAFSTSLLIGDFGEREDAAARALRAGTQAAGIGLLNSGLAWVLGAIAIAMLGRLLYYLFAGGNRPVEVSGADFYKLYAHNRKKQQHLKGA